MHQQDDTAAPLSLKILNRLDPTKLNAAALNHGLQ
jgi:hypothetical protein